jgi:putative transposase
MILTLNMLVEWSALSDESGNTDSWVERILWINLLEDAAIVINVFDPHAFPIPRTVQEISGAISSKKARLLETDPYSDLSCPEEKISAKHKHYRDTTWEIQAVLLENETPTLMLDRHERGQKIRQLSLSSGRSRTTLIKGLRRWWQCGRNRNAFLPNFKRCGGPGKRRLAKKQDAPKLGRPSALSKATGERIGVRITEDIERRFKRGVKKFYETPDKNSLTDAFDLTIQNYFHEGFTIVDGVSVPIIPPAEKLPTFKQFRYWYEKKYRNPIYQQKSRLGEVEYNRSSRALLGSSTQMAFGPGSLYQIDATVADLYLVNSLDRTKIIGRPVVYFCGDVFSLTISGFSATLEGPSWLGGMLALDNAIADKVAFCAEYDIGIEEDAWPCRDLPEAILADRGEFEGYNADNLVNALNIRVHNTGPYRPDWKGMIERRFGIANEKVIKFVPGYVPRPKKGGDPNYALKAVLTLDEFRKLLICYILDFNNNRYLKTYRKDEFMIADHVERYPLDIWNWGIPHRSGHLHTRPKEIVRLNLLPRKQVSVTPRGIHFEGELYYTCDLGLRESWFDRARIRGNWKSEVAYDLRSMDQIYLSLDGGTRLEVCHLTSASKHLIGRDWHDVVDYFELEKQAEEAARTRKYQASANLHAQMKQIIAVATEKTQAALEAVGKQSKSARRRGIRSNRAAERENERTQSAWILGTGNTGVPAQASHSTKVPEEEYVPRSSKVEQIRALRNKEWTKHEKR